MRPKDLLLPIRLSEEEWNQDINNDEIDKILT